MSAAKKTTRRTAPKKTSAISPSEEEKLEKPVIAAAPKVKWWKKLTSPFVRVWQWRKSLQPRTPHQSFRWTRRRDYERSLELPGYFAFSRDVWQTLWRYKGTFGGLIGAYALLTASLVGLASQSTYAQLGDLLRTSGGDLLSGNMGQLGEAGILLMAALTGGLNPNLSDSQQLISGLLVLMVWLTTVWLLRAYLAGSKPRLRDGFYNSGAPIIPTILLSLVLIVQLVPAAIAAIGVSAALPTGLISQGVESMLFWAVALLLVLLSLYWVTSTLIAMIVVTLPGVYPLSALKTAHELVVGRRLRIVLRIVWLIVATLVLWAVIMLPIILFDAWLKGALPAVKWLPLVPVMLVVTSTSSVVWIASYIYLLYRKVVDDGAAPA